MVSWKTKHVFFEQKVKLKLADKANGACNGIIIICYHRGVGWNFGERRGERERDRDRERVSERIQFHKVLSELLWIPVPLYHEQQHLWVGRVKVRR